MNWKAVSVKDRGFWTDHLSEDGRLLVAQGFNELERKAGRPYCLFDVSNEKRWLVLGFYSSADEAKKAAPVSLVEVPVISTENSVTL